MLSRALVMRRRRTDRGGGGRLRAKEARACMLKSTQHPLTVEATQTPQDRHWAQGRGQRHPRPHDIVERRITGHEVDQGLLALPEPHVRVGAGICQDELPICVPTLFDPGAQAGMIPLDASFSGLCVRLCHRSPPSFMAKDSRSRG
jgi:hypothetical protein